MSLFGKIFRGEFGLAKTFWLWGVTSAFIISTFFAFLLEGKITANDDVRNASILLLVIWSVFIGISIIRSAAYNRQRGFWGWVAIIFASLGILVILSFSNFLFSQYLLYK